MISYAARPASPLTAPGANAVPAAGAYMTGSHASRTRGSAAARAATSGPIPAGSPVVIATRGFIGQTSDFRLQTFRLASCQCPHEPQPPAPQLPEPQPPPDPQPEGL